MDMLTKAKNPSSKYVVVNDYYNNPAEAWPIIINNKISIINVGDEWLCIPEGETVDGWTGDSVDCIWHSRGCVDKNPLRAAMIVFLMMQEKSNGC